VHADRHLIDGLILDDGFWNEGLAQYRQEAAGVLLYSRDFLTEPW